MPAAREETPLLPHVLKQQPVTTSDENRTGEDHELRGFILMAISTFGFSGMTFFVHLAEDLYNFPTSTSLFLRAVIQITLSLAYMFRFLDVKHVIDRTTTRQWKLLALRGALGAIGMSCFFTALALLPMGEAVTVFFAGPVIAIIMSNVVLNEPITVIDCIAAVLSFAGVVLISQPDFDFSSSSTTQKANILGVALALAASFLMSAAYVTIRSLGTGIHFMQSVLSHGLGTIVVGVLMGGAMSPSQLLAHKEGTLHIIISSLFAFAGQCCMNKGLQLCRAGPGLLIRNLDVPVAYILGLLFLGETVSLLGIIGSFLVFFSAVMIGVRKIASP